MTRQEFFINWARFALLRWRVVRGRALPALAMAVMRGLDAWARHLEQRGRR
jgi:hypothetical protein